MQYTTLIIAKGADWLHKMMKMMHLESSLCTAKGHTFPCHFITTLGFFSLEICRWWEIRRSWFHKSSGVGPLNITDLDFADSRWWYWTTITASQAQESVEKSRKCCFNLRVGLHMNNNYIGAWMQSRESDMKTRKALAWKACNNINNNWGSKLIKDIE